MVREIDKYLTGLEKPFSNHNGDHSEAVFVMKALSVNAIGADGQPQSCEIAFQGFHSEQFFADGKEPLDGANVSIRFPNRQESFEQIQQRFPVQFLIVALLARRLARETEFFSDAKEIELPDWARTPEVQQVLDSIEQLELAFQKV